MTNLASNTWSATNWLRLSTKTQRLYSVWSTLRIDKYRYYIIGGQSRGQIDHERNMNSVLKWLRTATVWALHSYYISYKLYINDNVMTVFGWQIAVQTGRTADMHAHTNIYTYLQTYTCVCTYIEAHYTRAFVPNEFFFWCRSVAWAVANGIKERK